jgi:serine/threonine protein kinase
MYRDHGDELVPIQQYTPELETYQGKGHTSLVTHFQLSQLTRSDTLRGATTSYQEAIVIKRPRYSILEERSEGLVSFITELRVRNHAPLRSNPHIATLRGIGWDFEDPEGTIPRPILLEELAPQGAMDNLWKHWNFVRMTFKSRLELCRSIADGLNALHLCGVVHGDVKPENILVFPRNDRRDAFMVKLTDFGHSVLEQDGLEGLPAFTPLWCAPEATQKASMTFQDMVATDCYSYGLVVLSIMIGRAFYSSFDDVEGIKADGSILERSIALVEREDKESNDSDLEVDIVTSLLRKSLRLDPKSRSLRHCITIIDR